MKEEKNFWAEIVGMKKDFKHLADSFDEFKKDSKEQHKMMTDKFDELSHSLQALGGSFQAMSDLITRVTENEKWILKYKDEIQVMIEDRKDRKKRLLDVVWNAGVKLVAFLLLLYFAFLLQQSAVAEQTRLIAEIITP